MIDTTTKTDLQSYVDCVFDPRDIAEVRLLPGRKSSWHAAGDLPHEFERLNRENRDGQNIYVGANPRRAIGGSTAEDVAQARCLWVDFDDVSVEAARERIEAAKLPTATLTVSSGHGCHFYWRLDKPLTNLAEFTELQQALIRALDSDKSIHDAPRIMRLPGFLNVKAEPVKCEVVEVETDVDGNPRRYALKSFWDGLGQHLAAAAEPPPVQLVAKPQLFSNGNGLGTLERARLYISQAKLDALKQGFRNGTGFRLAAALTNDFLLSDADAWPLFCDWNSSCKPPMEERELLEVFESSKKNAKRPPGSKAASLLGGYSFTIGGKRIGDGGGTHQNGREQAKSTEPEPSLQILSAAELVRQNPTLSAPVVSGILRRGEVGNVIAPPKFGKSWLAYGLGFSVIGGADWLGEFRCEGKRVLLIDNELHKKVLANRIPAVAAAMGLGEDCIERLHVLSLRGELTDIFGIARRLETVEPRHYDLIILDALYRSLPAGVSENDNAAMASVFNLIDQIAGKLDCSWLNVHHASKGNQSDKAVTDVGAGAGAQSRAADAHVVLREHEEPGHVVLDAAVRSFAPVEPLALKWSFPLWLPADEDPSRLKRRPTGNELRQESRDLEGIGKLSEVLAQGPATERELRRRTGIGVSRIRHLLDKLHADGAITSTIVTVKGNECHEYQIVSQTT
jgi:hypothetical protein